MNKLQFRSLRARAIAIAGAVLMLSAFIVTASAQAALAESSDIALAVVGPMTGDFAAYGEEMRHGAQLAVDDVNARGGVDGRKMVLQVLDDGGKPSTALAIAKKLNKSGVRFVVGHYNSGTSIPASSIYAKNNTLMVSPASTNPRLTDSKLWNVIPTAGRDDVQGKFAGDYMAKHYPTTNLAIICDGTPYGDGLASKARQALKAASHPEKLFGKVKPRQTDFSKLIAKMEAAKIGAVFFAGLADEFGQLIRQASQAGLSVQFISGDGAMIKDLSAIAGPAVEGTLIMFSLEDRENPAAKEVVKSFRAQGFEPEAYTLKTYAAVQVIAQGLDMADSLAPRSVSAAIKSGQMFPTVIGNLTFDPKGDRREPDVKMYAWQKQTDGSLSLGAAD